MDIGELDRSLEQGIRSVFVATWRHKFLFVLTGSVVFALVIVGALSIQPVYEGATLLIGSQTTPEPDGTRKPAETSAALARVAESEEVVAEAIDRVGLETLALDTRPSSESHFEQLRRLVFPSAPVPHHQLSQRDVYLPGIMRALSVRGDPNADIVRIAFRHRDPTVAAQFANAVAQTFVDRQVELQGRPGAAEFFQRQRQRFDNEVKRTSIALQTFSATSGIYAIADQRKLLLTRLSDLASALALTRGSVAEKTGQRQALADQLRRLAPVARSPYVSALVDQLGPDRVGASARIGTPTDDRTGDPPLLLVKVYQDSMVELFKVNADLAGMQNLLKQQTDETARLSAELNGLTANEQTYAMLRRAVDEATYNSDLYARRMVEEQITAESNAAKLSSVKVLQKATVPVRPVFPNYILVTLAAAALGGAAGVGVAWRRERPGRSRMGRLRTA